MNSISEFCRRMREALDKREQATTEAERIEAIQEMTALIRSNFTKRREPADYKRAQYGDE